MPGMIIIGDEILNGMTTDVNMQVACKLLSKLYTCIYMHYFYAVYYLVVYTYMCIFLY